MITRQQFVGWVAAPVDSTLLQVPRALVASALAALVDFGVLILLVEKGSWSPLAAASFSYLLGGVVQYILCSYWVFPASPEKLSTGVGLFLLLSLVGLGITWCTMGLLHDMAHVNYALTKCVALGVAFWWNFLSRKFLLFKMA